MWWYYPSDVAPPLNEPDLEGEFVLVPRAMEPKPPKIVDIPIPKNTSNSTEEAEKPPIPPKPSIDINTELLSIDSLDGAKSSSERHTQENHNEPR